METKKVDEFTIEVKKETVETVVQKYDYNFLLSQKKAIEGDLAKFTAARQAEIDEVDALIAECEKLGIKPKEEKEDEITKSEEVVSTWTPPQPATAPKPSRSKKNK